MQQIDMDTHKTFKILVNSGLQEKVAEAVVECVSEARKSELEGLATKSDLKVEISSLRSELKAEIADVRGDIKVLNSKFNNIRWAMGAILSMCTAILVKLFMMGSNI